MTKTVHFNEKEYLINKMIESNPSTSESTIKRIVNDLKGEWRSFTFKLEVNPERLVCDIIDEEGQPVKLSDLPTLGKQYYSKLLNPYLFNRSELQ